MGDRAALLAANTAFYEAFEQADLAAMERVWAGRPGDVCIHPGWAIQVGWAEVREGWAGIFSGGGRMRVQVELTDAEVLGEVGRITAVENLWTGDGAALLGRVATTNLFVLVDGEWRMILHHGSQIMGETEATEAAEPEEYEN